MIDWETIAAQKTNGISGFVMVRVVELATFKIRQLSFSPNYEADHWCQKGHIIHVQKGELIIEYKNNTMVKIPELQSLILGDGLSWHKARTVKEAEVLIID